MNRHFRRFSAGENGAVTVEWVLLAAGAIALALAVAAAVASSTGTLGEAIGTGVGDRSAAAPW
ncbi:MAG: hypothetical protein ACU0AT_05865 [Tranquillimonas sp.]